MLSVRKLLARDQEPLGETFPHQQEGRFEEYYIEHLREMRLVFVALEQDEEGHRDYFGYVSILWEAPSTALWQRNIPEIVDLYVHEELRRQGIAKALLQACEEAAHEKGYRKIGLSVGHGEEFAPARQLYQKMAYVPLAQSQKEMILAKELAGAFHFGAKRDKVKQEAKVKEECDVRARRTEEKPLGKL